MCGSGGVTPLIFNLVLDGVKCLYAITGAGPLLFEQVAWLAPKEVWAVGEEKYILFIPGKETRILDFQPLA
jgi:hypothetical protein